MRREASFRSRRVRIPGSGDQWLAGIVDEPAGGASFRAVFAHCFTCGKDLKGIVRISRAMAQLGFAVLRFDFAGIGDSSGEFSQTTFEDNRRDLRAAVRWMNSESQLPLLLIGHSLGGAAALSVAGEFSEVRALVNIAAPANTQHLADYLIRANPAIRSQGAGDVTIGGRAFRITQAMVETLQGFDLPAAIRKLTLPLLILFSPQDETLPYLHAQQMLEWAGGPTSLINLDDADHLLVADRSLAPYVGQLIAAWSRRYLDPPPPGVG